LFQVKEKKMKCKKCGSKVFLVDEIDSCDDCKHNGAWDTEEQEYVYDQKQIDELDLTRDHVEEEGECLYGNASGSGCLMITCKTCGHEFNVPTVEY